MSAPALSAEQLRNHLVERKRVGYTNYCPALNKPTEAVMLMCIACSETWKELDTKPQDHRIPFSFAIEYHHEVKTDAQIEQHVSKFIASMRSALSRLRKQTIRQGKTPLAFKIFKRDARSWMRHTNPNYIVVHMEYTENDVRNSVNRFVKDLTI